MSDLSFTYSLEPRGRVNLASAVFCNAYSIPSTLTTAITLAIGVSGDNSTRLSNNSKFFGVVELVYDDNNQFQADCKLVLPMPFLPLMIVLPSLNCTLAFRDFQLLNVMFFNLISFIVL